MENYDSMNDISVETALQDLRYLQLLSKQFPTISDACTEIINLEAILNLPKGTEHFLTDIHGEYEAFQHVLKNASGTVRRKVNEIFGQTLRESEKKELCTLIYYPDHKLELIKSHHASPTDQSMSKCFFEIYSIKGKKGSPCRIFLYLTGTAARIADRPEQTGLCERYHLVYYIDRASRLFYYRHVQPHTTTHDRHIAYRRRHI